MARERYHGPVLVNFGWIEEGRVAGMARPDPDAWPQVRSRGIGAVLTLTERPPPGDPEAAGLESLHVPIRDFGTPSEADLARCVRWMREQLDAGRAVVVHCHAGLGRTGTVLAAWLTSTGLGPHDAVDLVRRLRPGSVETEEQARLVVRFAEQARPEGAGP
jgi:protein-tyrosine phosphatase